MRFRTFAIGYSVALALFVLAQREPISVRHEGFRRVVDLTRAVDISLESATYARLHQPEPALVADTRIESPAKLVPGLWTITEIPSDRLRAPLVVMDVERSVRTPGRPLTALSQGPAVAVMTSEPQVYPEGEFLINRTRVVFAKAGVSLLSIANQYDIALSRLLEFNDLKEEDVLTRDQLLFLQRKRRTGAAEFHIVQEGESVYDICQKEGVRYQDLMEMNQLSLGAQPAAGEKIYLQSSAPSRPVVTRSIN